MQIAHDFFTQMLQVAAAGAQVVDLGLIHVDAETVDAAGVESPQQRQFVVAQADDSGDCRALPDLFSK